LQRFTAGWGRSSAVKLRLQAFAALYSWVGTQLGCKTLFYSWWERSSAVKLQLQAFAAFYSWVGTQLGCKTAAAKFCSKQLVGTL